MNSLSLIIQLRWETSTEVISDETDMCKLLGVHWNNLSD